MKPTDDDEVTDGYIVVERYARDERFLALFLVILILAFVVKVSS